MNIKSFIFRYLITSASIAFFGYTLNAHSPLRRRNQIKKALQSDQPTPKLQADSADLSLTSEKEKSAKLLQEIVQQANNFQAKTSAKEIEPTQHAHNKAQLPELQNQAVENNELTINEPVHLLAQQDTTNQINEEPAPDQETTTITPALNEQLPKEDATAKDVLQSLAVQQEEEEKIELQFEDADLTTFTKQIEALFDITFITDEAIQPLKEDATKIGGNKITFKSHKPMTKQEAWDLLTTFLEIAGFTIVPQADPSFYRIQILKDSRLAPIPAYIGTDHEKLPDNDQIIRYVYFIKNSTSEAMTSIVKVLKSNDAPLIELKEQKAFLLTDKSYNIKTLMKIVKELDKVSAPQAMSVIKLRNADATEVKKLYDSLIGVTEETTYRPFTTRRQPTSLYFPDTTRIIAETRTNTLILLGTKDAIEKIEDFIKKYVDVELDQPYSPLHTYQLKYADAATIATIMTNVTTFGQSTPVGQNGGVRGQDKYLQPMSFTAEKETNRLIIRGQYEDYLRTKEIIDELDKQQPQVSIEILILSLSIKEARELGTQLRNKVPGPDGLLGKNVNFQTSGLRAGGNPKGIVENKNAQSGAMRLLGNMLELVTQAPAGNTIISLGRDLYDVWGVLQILQTATNAQIISNPYLTTTNKTKASISVGEKRRVKTGEVITSGQIGEKGNLTLDNETAALEVIITPQINSDGMIILDLSIDISEFTVPATENENSGDISTKLVKTQITVADKEVIALGGLVKNSILDSLSKTPILGDIPLIGWLFKNKRKQKDQDNLLILISTRIINPEATSEVNQLTQARILDYQGTLSEMQDVSEKHDPIHKLFFAGENKTDKTIEDFIFERDKGNKRSLNRRRQKRSNAARKNANNNKMAKSQKQLESLATSKPEPVSPEAHTIEKKEIVSKNEELHNKIKNKKRSQFSLSNLLSQNDSGSRV